MPKAPVIVIGAGFGGLCAAVELARQGACVVVVEQSAGPGGKAQSVLVGHTPINVGPTVLTMRGVFDSLFESVGKHLDDAVNLHASSLVARHAFADGSRLDLFTDIERSAHAVAAFAGEREAENYRRFAAHGAAILATVRRPFLESERPSVTQLLSQASHLGFRSLGTIDAHRTMWKAICASFRDARLRALFARYATYVGSSPFQAPATLNLIAEVEREGVSIVDGGMSALARAVADLAVSLGVTFRFNARVTGMIESAGRINRVTIESHSQPSETLEACAVIANADVATLAGGHLGDLARHAVSPITPTRRSLSAVTWAIVGRVEGFDLAYHNVFFSNDYPAEYDALFGTYTLANDSTVYVCAQDRTDDSARVAAPPMGTRESLAASQSAPLSPRDERLFIIVNAPARADLSPLSDRDVERCERTMMARLAQAGLRLTISAKHVMTPSYYETAAPSTGGAIYGEAAHGPMAALTRAQARTKIPNLFLAGGSVHPGPGVPMAAMSGKTAAQLTLQYLRSM